MVAPLHPGGSRLALKAVPLLLPLRGVIKRDIYTLQWSSMVILIYFIEGVVRAWSDKAEISRIMALGEVLLVVCLFRLRPALPAPLQEAGEEAGQGAARQGQSRRMTERIVLAHCRELIGAEPCAHRRRRHRPLPDRLARPLHRPRARRAAPRRSAAGGRPGAPVRRPPRAGRAAGRTHRPGDRQRAGRAGPPWCCRCAA